MVQRLLRVALQGIGWSKPGMLADTLVFLQQANRHVHHLSCLRTHLDLQNHGLDLLVYALALCVALLDVASVRLWATMSPLIKSLWFVLAP